jgi:hypothetical protein
MSTEKSLQRMEPTEMAVTQQQQSGISLQSITEKIMSGELTKEKLDMVKDLVAMDAERKFAAAFVSLQNEMPKVRAQNPVKGKDGMVKYYFAAFEDIMRQVQPLLQKHGFSVSFSMRFEATRVIQTCTLQHRDGHKKCNDFAARVGQGPPHSSEAQGDGAASTYAKRFALCDALNIVVEKMDDDARAEGDFISKEQVAELSRRVAETNTKRDLFLKWADADSFETIRAVSYDRLDEFLAKKEQQGR